MNSQPEFEEPARSSQFNEPRRAAFTLVELLVVIAVVAVLSTMLLPVLARTRPNNLAAQCMNNQRQLMAATLFYASDHNDLFPPNPDDGNLFFGHNWVQGNATGSGRASNWGLAQYYQDGRRFLLLPYVKTINVLKCPADRRIGRFMDGTSGPALRTISMNGAVGTICQSWKGGGAHAGIPLEETQAPHLTGIRNDPAYRRYNKTSTIVAPKPAMLWVFLDESQILLNDGAFGFRMVDSRWVDAPGRYHNGACGFAFADGHFEFKKWRSSVTGRRLGAITPGTPEEEDYLWMRARTSAAR